MKINKSPKEKVLKQKKGYGQPISHELIYKIMVIIALVVTSAFLVINIISFNIPAIITVVACLVLLAANVVIAKVRNLKDNTKELLISLTLLVVAFSISIFSGASFSDDFPLYLAIIGLTGAYMEPTFTKIQIICADVALVALYFISPEKAGALGQYILCFVMFNLAAWIFYMAIYRGRSYIELSRNQTEEAQALLKSIREMGDILQNDFDNSSRSIDESTNGLEKGSQSITDEATQVSDSCYNVHEKIRATELHIDALNRQVRSFELSLTENESNIEAMKQNLVDVNNTISEAASVFSDMRQHMNEVAEIAEKLGEIAFKTTLLSLNASVEAAHAGSSGAGFAVVANEMKELSKNSNNFSLQVAEVVSALLQMVEQTSAQFTESTEAITNSQNQMTELQNSFTQLTRRFDKLYDNISTQNDSISEVDILFEGLKEKVNDMQLNSAENQTAVSNIVRAMDNYRINIEKVIENTKI